MNNLQYFIILFTVLLFNQNAQGQEWELSEEKKSVTVYTRETSGSSVKEFKAHTTIDVSIEDLMETIIYVDNYPAWYDHCKHSSEIRRKSDSSLVYYIEYSMPFPFRNRDVVNQMNIHRHGEKITISFFKKDNIEEEKDGIVRMPVSEGSWILTKINEHQTEVVHVFKGDPAGNVPPGIVNLFLVAGPINTLSQLKEYIISNEPIKTRN